MGGTKVYMALAALGAALPLAVFAPWVAAHGLDPTRFAGDLFVNPVSSFFALDVTVAAIVLTVFVLVEGAGVRHRWLAIAATFLVGVSCGLPLFLALRARGRVA